MDQARSLVWRKASYSGSNGGGCVEIATTPGTVLTRDSMDPNPNRPILTFSEADWRTFLADLTTGRHDL